MCLILDPNLRPLIKLNVSECTIQIPAEELLNCVAVCIKNPERGERGGEWKEER